MSYHGLHKRKLNFPINLEKFDFGALNQLERRINDERRTNLKRQFGPERQNNA